VAVGAGGIDGNVPAEAIQNYFMYNFIEPVAMVGGQGAASCFSCGYGETCKVGITAFLFGPNTKITPDMIPDVKKQPEVMAAAVDAGKLLGKRLTEGHDRKAVTQKMQQKIMEMMEASA
jgi:hypothetical protein